MSSDTNGCSTFAKAAKGPSIPGFRGTLSEIIVLIFREPPTSCLINGRVQEIPEMRVEFVVPDNLDKCELKPYVSWRAEVINEPPLTSKSLFDMRYSDRVIQLHKTGSSPEEIISKL
ncbi:unnamed protein product [Hydatigera taeniaeformis]|uniref:Ribosomal protein/NADH dehydrogenase domain-containing protein n=1 Tax=Hydatigena taeniaeformis TaxID=6205 RepID=A0A0R3XC33_HYDTA|nr:unnamed protein product [Hydatigera taeniaeformis]